MSFAEGSSLATPAHCGGCTDWDIFAETVPRALHSLPYSVLHLPKYPVLVMREGKSQTAAIRRASLSRVLR